MPFDTAAADPAEAEALAAVGDRVLATRAAVVARVAPLGGIARESMRQATRRAEQHIAQLLAKVRKSARLGAARHMIAAEGLAAVGTLIARYRDGGRFTSDDEIARITVALRDLRVRDDAWARMDPGHSGAHQRLWIDVVRRAQPGYVAAPAALLAFVAWQSGDGALANVALDRALADDPRYSMALLLRQVITAGAPPALARLPMTPEEVAASYDGRDVDDPDPEMPMMSIKVTTGPRPGDRSGYGYTAWNVCPAHREDARMTADTHEVAVARLRAAYTAVPPGTPVRLAKHTSNLFRFRDAGAPVSDRAAGCLGVRSCAARRPGPPDRLGRRHDHL